MSQKPINRSPDLQRLRDDGYDIEIRANHLVVRHVPYVSANREVRLGSLVSPLILAGDVTTTPADHTIMFQGEYPHHADGTPIEAIRNSSGEWAIDTGFLVQHKFSGKNSASADRNYHEKVVRYVEIISGQAALLDPTATARVNRFVEADPDDDSPFAYLDTASSTAGIMAINRKLALGAVAIVGLGGSGSYVLDLVSKTPVKAIHLFDGDRFLQHNAFRSPGAASRDELRLIPMKVRYFADRYSLMHRGIAPHPFYLDRSNAEELHGVDFVFLCMDRGTAKRDLVACLREWKIPFIEVGMGVDVSDDALAGILRVTTVTPGHPAAVTHVAYVDADENDNYSKAIQVADLNALNATLAVIKWKKLFGVYRDLGRVDLPRFRGE